MNKSFVYIAVFVIASTAIIAGCSQKKTTDINFTTLKGFSLSPSAFTQDGMADFFQRAGSIVTWAGSWDQLVDNRSAPYVVQELSGQYNYKPVIITEIGGNEINSGLLRSRFSDVVVSFAGKYKPEYIGLGNEINLEYEESPQLFEQKMEFYGRVYGEIKAVSPDTRVFTVFQLERMKGRKDGLFGKNATAPYWFLLGNASKFDVIAFTTYPSLIYKDPADIPNDYYKEIRLHTPKPIAFSEVAWFHEGQEGWESVDFEQARFIRLFFLLNTDSHPEFAIWPFLYDPAAAPPADKMGLIYNSTIAFDAWTAA